MADSAADDRIQRVTMPKWGLSMTTGTITEWLVSEGDDITSGDDLVEIDTEKIAGALESTVEGTLRRIVADVGVAVPVGATIAVVAPADVSDDDLDAVVTAAREQIAAGAVPDVEGPDVGTVDVAGRSIAYATMGDGADVVVLVHGYGGDANSWLFVQEPLSRSHTVHAIDLPGHGRSGKDVGDGSLETLAAAVTGYLDARDITSAHLVGHSVGGAVAAAVAAAHPDRVRSLTLVAPAGVGSAINADYLRGFAAAGSRRELRPLLGTLFADPDLVTRQLVDDLLKYKRLDGVQQALDTLRGTLVDGDAQAIDVTSLLSGLDLPVVVVWGAADAVIPAGNADALPDSAQVTLVEGAGHMAHMEKPSAVVEAVERATGS